MKKITVINEGLSKQQLSFLETKNIIGGEISCGIQVCGLDACAVDACIVDICPIDVCLLDVFVTEK
jgi:hypothetical protein